MISYFVRYDGQASNSKHFTDYYRTRHADILSRFDGIQNLVLHQPVTWHDPFPITPGDSMLLAQMTFASEDDLRTALQSPARADARDDFANFPRFDGRVFHQALRSETIF